jgi:hypothetical protein
MDTVKQGPGTFSGGHFEGSVIEAALFFLKSYAGIAPFLANPGVTFFYRSHEVINLGFTGSLFLSQVAPFFVNSSGVHFLGQK